VGVPVVENPAFLSRVFVLCVVYGNVQAGYYGSSIFDKVCKKEG